MHTGHITGHIHAKQYTNSKETKCDGEKKRSKHTITKRCESTRKYIMQCLTDRFLSLSLSNFLLLCRLDILMEKKTFSFSCEYITTMVKLAKWLCLDIEDTRILRSAIPLCIIFVAVAAAAAVAHVCLFYFFIFFFLYFTCSLTTTTVDWLCCCWLLQFL